LQNNNPKLINPTSKTQPHGGDLNSRAWRRRVPMRTNGERRARAGARRRATRYTPLRRRRLRLRLRLRRRRRLRLQPPLSCSFTPLSTLISSHCSIVSPLSSLLAPLLSPLSCISSLLSPLSSLLSHLSSRLCPLFSLLSPPPSLSSPLSCLLSSLSSLFAQLPSPLCSDPHLDQSKLTIRCPGHGGH